MPKEALFTMKLESDLHAEFMAAADASHRPASQIMRELMREFIQSRRAEAEYDAWLAKKVEAAREEIQSGQGIPDEVVRAEFAARREALMRSSKM